MGWLVMVTQRGERQKPCDEGVLGEDSLTSGKSNSIMSEEWPSSQGLSDEARVTL